MDYAEAQKIVEQIRSKPAKRDAATIRAEWRAAREARARKEAE